MTSPAFARTALLLALLQGATGCSFGMKAVQPPISPPDRPVDCNSATTAPVLDTICATLFLSGTINLAGARTCDPNNPFDTSNCVDSDAKSKAILLAGGLAALCTVGAVVGWSKASACGEVKALNQRCIAGDDPACMKLNSAWTPPMRLPPLPAAAPAAPTAPLEGGCTKDTDCKGDRVCERGTCVAPRVNGGT